MAYKVIILYRLYMPSYFLGTFAEYPKIWVCERHTHFFLRKEAKRFYLLCLFLSL